MLSNTATPRYYGEFRAKVMAGLIPINKEIEMEMHRIDDMIADPTYYYDDKIMDRYIAFCENELVLTDGSPLKLMEPFKLWAEALLSWFRFEEQILQVPTEDGRIISIVRREKRRAINEQYLIIPRGAGKTIYAETIHAFFLICDKSTTKQVAVAYSVEQADETISPLRTAITMSRGPLFKMLTMGNLHNTTGKMLMRPKLYASKAGIEFTPSDSSIRLVPMRVDRLQSIRPKILSIDEWLSTDIRENVFNAARESLSKTKDYVLFGISSEGTVRNSFGDDVKMELMTILRGELKAPNRSIWYYKLDNLDEVGDPRMWIKANPCLGQSVFYEVYQQDVELAEKSPSAKNEILAKRFNLPMEGFTYFFTYEETKTHPYHTFRHMPCAMGCDLSRGDDFCSFTFLFPLRDGCFGVKTRSYISQLTHDKLTPSMYMKYGEFIQEGSLCVMDGTVLNIPQVYDDLNQFIEAHNYDIRCVGYDTYNADDFINRWIAENSPFGVEKVIQGSRTESVPLGELKQLASERMLIFDEQLMTFTMGNCVVNEDNNGNRKLTKKRADQKIDAVAAMMDAYVAYKLNLDAFL